MLKIKSGPTGARIFGVRGEVIIAVFMCTEVYAAHGLDFVWTCGIDSKHMAGSLHYVGLSLDGSLPPPEQKESILSDLRARLGDDYDVVEEGDHVHIEFQPKTPLNRT